MFSFVHKYKDGPDISFYVGSGSCWNSDFNKALKFASTKAAIEFVCADFKKCKRTESGSSNWSKKDLLDWMIEYDVHLEFR